MELGPARLMSSQLNSERSEMPGTVLNSGTGAAGASTLGFYLSTDAVLSANDTLVGTAAINPLGASASQLASGNVTVLPPTS